MNFNDTFQTLALNLYNLLSTKYNIQKGEFSSAKLSSIAFSLGNRKKQLSFDETNKILNVTRRLNAIEQGIDVTKQEVDDLEKLYRYFQKIDKNKEQKISKLEIEFQKLSMKSRDAIINENEFDDFKEYMHIVRPIENEFEQALIQHLLENRKSILFVVGNVGDGKSHILSYMMKKYDREFHDYDIKIHNDATETDSPTGTSIETMKRVLYQFSDANIENDEESRLVVAINLGMLTNLMDELKKESNYTKMVGFLENSSVLSSRKISDKLNTNFRVISFTEQRNFELQDGKIRSDFYEQVMDKIYKRTPDNPFYQAYKEDMVTGMNKLLHKNYEYMLRDDFKESIKYLLVRSEIEYKIIISARMLFNFFFDITMPRNEKNNYDSYLPYLLFENSDKSELLALIHSMDPIKNQTRKIDEASIEIYHAPNTINKISELLGEEINTFYNILESFRDNTESFNHFINTYLRIKFLINKDDDLFDTVVFEKYLQYYSDVEAGMDVLGLFELVQASFNKWNGDSGRQDYVIKNSGKSAIKILAEIDLEPVNNYLVGTSIALIFSIENKEHEVVIDYRTFEILYKLNKGYFLKEEDKQIAINFDFFVNELVSGISKSNKNIVVNTNNRQEYELKKFMNKISLTKGSV